MKHHRASTSYLKKKNNKNYVSERKIKKIHMATVEDEIRFPGIHLPIHLPLPEPRISHVTYVTNGKTTIIESIKEQIKWKSCGLTLLSHQRNVGQVDVLRENICGRHFTHSLYMFFKLIFFFGRSCFEWFSKQNLGTISDLRRTKHSVILF